jgi:diketogulonate reductase-like aldo/keto reductase
MHCQDNELRAMAQRYHLSPAQLLLVYSLQKGYTPIVRATRLEHLHANLKAETVVIMEQDMSILDTWDKGAKGSICRSFCNDMLQLLTGVVPWLINAIDA